jgi:hypothetical protein
MPHSEYGTIFFTSFVIHFARMVQENVLNRSSCSSLDQAVSTGKGLNQAVDVLSFFHSLVLSFSQFMKKNRV